MAYVKASSVNEASFDAESLGEVESYVINWSSDAANDAGLSSPRLFGPTVDYMCCREIVHREVEIKDANGETIRVRKCPNCGSITYPSSTREDIRSFITLNFPIINPVLAGDYGGHLASILNIEREKMKQLCTCKAGYSVTDEEIIPVNTIMDVYRTDILLQGEAALHLIKKFDIEDAISEHFLQLIKSAYFKDTCSIYDIGDVSPEPSSLYLTCGWYLHLSAEYDKYIRRGKSKYISEEMLLKDIVLPNTKNPMTRLSLLLNCPKDKSKLFAMVSERIRVTPAGTRREIDMRHDPITQSYRTVLERNAVIRTLQRDGSIVNKAARIGELYNAVRGVLVRNITKKEGNYALREVIDEKEGLIRQKMLGKRVDWSGRSVIVVDPTLELDQCGIPFEMAKVLFRFHLVAEGINIHDDEAVRRALETSILQRVPIILNRAPTLHRLSLLAFFGKLTDRRAISLHPLVCEGYNADFDGDTMAAHIPISSYACNEARELMLSIYNLRHPANGEIVIKPKQEMVFGLYTATKYTRDNATGVTHSISDLESVYTWVIEHKIKVYDMVNCAGELDSAGRMALRYCIPRRMWANIQVLSKKTLGPFMEEVIKQQPIEYSKSIARLMRLGFAVATLYIAPLSILNPLPKEVTQGFDQFFNEIRSLDEEYANGFEAEDHYNAKYTGRYSKLKDSLENQIYDIAGRGNGYSELVESGARGDTSNLMQMFVAKGIVMRDQMTSFNMAITSSYLSQLSPFEHFVAAYGTRKTLIDKVHKTGDTGYAMRRMSHATSPTVIQTEDCGTTKGIVFKVSEMARLIPADASGGPDLKTAASMIVDFAAGRYEAGTNRMLAPSAIQARLEADGEIEVRSILKCEAPCCSKCYGIDLTLMSTAVVGTPIGYMAAQAIGEPGTQLTMRTFHSGGVAGKADMTSAFDKMEALIDFTHRDDYLRFPTYDPIAWASGEISETVVGLEKSITIGDHPKKITLPLAANIKKTVEIGEGLCMVEGTHCIHEIQDIIGVDEAQMYLLLSFTSVYHGQAKINIKHFEVLTDAMTRYFCYDTAPTTQIKIGQSLSHADYCETRLGGRSFKKRIVSVDSTPRTSTDFLANLAYAYIMEGLFMAHYHNAEDSLTKPYNRMMFGLPPLAGTYNVDYIGKRRMASQGA